MARVTIIQPNITEEENQRRIERVIEVMKEVACSREKVNLSTRGLLTNIK